jgi:hypothetical protein
MKSWLEQRAGWGRRATKGRVRAVSYSEHAARASHSATARGRAGATSSRGSMGPGSASGEEDGGRSLSAAGWTAGRNSSDGRTAAEREAWGTATDGELDGNAIVPRNWRPTTRPNSLESDPAGSHEG